jgi:hypothetical protein
MTSGLYVLGFEICFKKADQGKLTITNATRLIKDLRENPKAYLVKNLTDAEKVLLLKASIEVQGKSEDRSAELVHTSTSLPVKKLNVSVVFIEAQTEHNPAGQLVVDYVFPFWIS